jgi:tetratricopeptide (TPR) repeat protein
MEGRSAEALAAARKMAANVSPETIEQMPMIQFVPTYEVLTLARFGRWGEVLKIPAPPESQVYASGVWHYAQGLARAAVQDEAGAARELAAVRNAAQHTPADMMISINFAGPLLRIASHLLEAEIASRHTKRSDAIAHLRTAVSAEDSLHYDEPPTWYAPARQRLGAELLAAGKAREAETVYREDLARHPENGWSLAGLAKALRSQGRDKEAAVAELRFRKAWARADVKLTGSTF